MKETHKIPAFMCSKQGINGAVEVKGMRHQQGEDQGNKPFPVAMLILSGDETPRGEKKKKTSGACHILCRRLCRRKGCWLGVCWLSNFTLVEVSPWWVKDTNPTPQTGLGVPCCGTRLGRGSFAIRETEPMVQLLSHGLRSCTLPWLYPVVPRDQGDSVCSALMTPGSPKTSGDR